MYRLSALFVFCILCLSVLDTSAAPRKRRAVIAKPTLEWVKDNSKLFTVSQAEELNNTIKEIKDSVKIFPKVYVVTQNSYATKSPYYKAFQSSTTNDKWYISESKEYANDFVILVRPKNKLSAESQLHILCDKNSPVISRFISSQKIDQLQSEYTKRLNEASNSTQVDVVQKLILALQSRFFDEQIRDYTHTIGQSNTKEIANSIKIFTDKTSYKVAVITTSNNDKEDSVFAKSKTKKANSKEIQDSIIVEYENLNADLVFVFYPKGVYLFSKLDKEILSDKAISNLLAEYTQPQAKSGQYKEAMEASLIALSDHMTNETLLDGMSLFEKVAAVLLGIGIPVAFCWFIFKDSFKKTKTKPTSTTSKPTTSKPVVTKPVNSKPTTDKKPAQLRVNKPTDKPEKKTEKVPSQSVEPTLNVLVPTNILPLLKLSKPSEGDMDRGWTLDNTGSLSVVMNKIDDLFKPISPRNEHEKVMLEMIDYMRSLREYTDQEIAYSLGIGGVSIYLDELYGYVDPAAVRIVFNRGLDLLMKNYAERDPRVSKYVSTTRR